MIFADSNQISAENAFKLKLPFRETSLPPSLAAGWWPGTMGTVGRSRLRCSGVVRVRPRTWPATVTAQHLSSPHILNWLELQTINN